jgi:hypothetical protein
VLRAHLLAELLAAVEEAVEEVRLADVEEDDVDSAGDATKVSELAKLLCTSARS